MAPKGDSKRSVMRGITEAFGGEVLRPSSSAGHGLTRHLHWPDEEGPKKAEGLVLVIDQQEQISDLLRNFFHPYGIEVRGFTNPYDAVLWFKKHWKEVDLVFLNMKNARMDGEYCFALLQSIDADVRVALMADSRAGSQNETVSELLEEGALHIFSKPFSFPGFMSWAMNEGMRKSDGF